MGTMAHPVSGESAHPVRIFVEPAHDGRNRLTTAFRIILAIPHLILVGGPLAIALSMGSSGDAESGAQWTSSGGVLGAVAAVCAIMSWFVIVFTARHPDGLWRLAAVYLRWRVRAAAYVGLLRDEYPPFGDGPYPASVELTHPDGPRDRLTVAFRIILAIPHLIAIWALGIAWAITTVIAWFAILFTGEYPEALYRFAVGVLQWNVRVDAYLLLLHDEYPPFSLGPV
jgi:Domain of unknown function (DUF4389)